MSLSFGTDRERFHFETATVFSYEFTGADEDAKQPLPPLHIQVFIEAGFGFHRSIGLRVNSGADVVEGCFTSKAWKKAHYDSC